MKKKFFIITGSALLLLALVIALVLSSEAKKAANPTGATTSNLKIINRSLKEFWVREGSLPESFGQLDITPEALLDGNGRLFMMVHRKVAADRPGHGHYVIVGMSRPAKESLFSEPWWYAIVQDYPDSNEIEIKSGSDEEGRQRLAAEYE
jgi:hypothetical protein